MKQSFIRQGTCVVCTNMTCGKPQKVGGIRAERYVMNTKAKETHNIDAVCFAAKYPEGHIKVRLREILARIGMIWDYVSGVKPETLEKVGEAILPATTSTKISEDK